VAGGSISLFRCTDCEIFLNNNEKKTFRIFSSLFVAHSLVANNIKTEYEFYPLVAVAWASLKSIYTIVV
jgi:hypothetical protein